MTSDGTGEMMSQNLHVEIGTCFDCLNDQLKCVYVRVCVRACVRACLCVCVFVSAFVYVCGQSCFNRIC